MLKKSALATVPPNTIQPKNNAQTNCRRPRLAKYPRAIRHYREVWDLLQSDPGQQQVVFSEPTPLFLPVPRKSRGTYYGSQDGEDPTVGLALTVNRHGKVTGRRTVFASSDRLMNTACAWRQSEPGTGRPSAMATRSRSGDFLWRTIPLTRGAWLPEPAGLVRARWDKPIPYGRCPLHVLGPAQVEPVGATLAVARAGPAERLGGRDSPFPTGRLSGAG